MSNSTASKIPERRTNNLEAFSSVNSEIQHNTNGLFTVSSTFLQKVTMAAFVYSFYNFYYKQE